MRIYLGHDGREQAAFDVAAKTARSFGCEVIPLYEDRLRMSGMLTRPVDRRERRYDLNSNANESTSFAVARFFVPLLAHSGWAMFADADVVFMDNPQQLMELADESKAVMCVKHPTYELTATKMDNQVQSSYPRKLWSSVMIFNASHPANKRLNLTTLNQWPGRDLHAFKWLSDDEIGDLPLEANWLVGITPKPERPIIAHMTLGGPWLAGWVSREHDELWLAEAGR